MATKRAAKTNAPRTNSVDRNAEPTAYQDAREDRDGGEEDNGEIEASFETSTSREPVSSSTDNGLPPYFSVDEDDIEDQELPRRRSAGKTAKSAKSSDLRQSASAGATLTQKAKEIVTRGGEELSQRYGLAFDDVKVASKKVQEEIKKQPYRLVLGAAGVVGLGLALAKRYTQNRGKASPSSSEDLTNS